jgi:hypothetical protein
MQTGMSSRCFGIPQFTIQHGAYWQLPEHTGAIGSRGLLGAGTVLSDLRANGMITNTILASAMLYYANLAGGRNLSSDIFSPIGQLIGTDLRGKAVIESDIFIGFKPSADDIVYAMMDTPSGAIESSMTLRQALKVLLAVVAGKTEITDLGGGAATVKFRDVGDSKDVVTANMTGSERTSVALDKT